MPAEEHQFISRGTSIWRLIGVFVYAPAAGDDGLHSFAFSPSFQAVWEQGNVAALSELSTSTQGCV